MYRPTCKHCGEHHFNFRPCKPREEAKAAAPKPATLHVVWQPNDEYRPFGDRLEHYENRGGNLHLLPPKRTPDGEEAA